jgi:hypothetical protein
MTAEEAAEKFRTEFDCWTVIARIEDETAAANGKRIVLYGVPGGWIHMWTEGKIDGIKEVQFAEDYLRE